MTNIKGEHLITINAHAGESYCIDYGAGYFVNILNQTDGVISVSTVESYKADNDHSCCMKLIEDAFYYDLDSRLYSTLYISSAGDGYITLVRSDYSTR